MNPLLQGRSTGYFRPTTKNLLNTMKRLISIALLSLIIGPALGQTVNTKKVDELLLKKDYMGAMREWSGVKRQLQDLASAELLKVIPPTVGELKLQPTDSRQTDTQGGITLMVTYQATSKSGAATDAAQKGPEGLDPRMRMSMPGGQESIQLTITTNLMMASEVSMAHTGDNNTQRGGDSGQSETLRIKGYRAIMRIDRNMGTTGQMIVGGAYIRAEGRGMKDSAPVMDLLNAIDTEQLKRIVGE